MAATDAPPAPPSATREMCKTLDTEPTHTPLALPTFADPALAHYRVGRETEEHAGWDAVPIEQDTELCHPDKERRRIYPTLTPGLRLPAAAFEQPTKNVLVKVRVNGAHRLAWLDDVIAAGLAHAGAVQVPRRAWRLCNGDGIWFEDPAAAAYHGHKPVATVIGWCPALGPHPDNPAALSPHGRVYGTAEKPPSKRYGKGCCLRCDTQEARDATKKKVARLRAGGIL